MGSFVNRAVVRSGIRNFLWCAAVSTASSIALALPARAATAGVKASTQPSPQVTKENLPAAKKLMEQLDSIRIQKEMYWLQHHGRDIDLKRFPNWEQLTDKTDDAGNPSPDGKLGPYIRQVPVNPLNGRSDVLLSDRTPKFGEKLSRPCAFVLARDGDLRGTDASGRFVLFDQDVARVARSVNSLPAMPQDETPEGRKHSVVNTLNMLASMIELYKLQHRDQLPDFKRYDDWEQFLKPTDYDGTLNEHADCGPYLDRPPVNALTGYTRVIVTTDGRKTPQQLVEGKYGYAFSPSECKLWAIDERGNCLAVPHR